MTTPKAPPQVLWLDPVGCELLPHIKGRATFHLKEGPIGDTGFSLVKAPGPAQADNARLREALEQTFMRLNEVRNLYHNSEQWRMEGAEFFDGLTADEYLEKPSIEALSQSTPPQNVVIVPRKVNDGLAVLIARCHPSKLDIVHGSGITSRESAQHKWDDLLRAALGAP